MLEGRGVANMLGRRGESVRNVRPNARVRSEGGGWSELGPLPGLGASGRTSRGSEGEGRGAEDVNQSSLSGSGRTWARDRVGGFAARKGSAREVRHGCCTCRVRRREMDVRAGSLRMGMLVIYAVTFLCGELARGVEGGKNRRSYVQFGGKMLYNFMAQDAARRSGVRSREIFGGGDVTGLSPLAPKATRHQGNDSFNVLLTKTDPSSARQTSVCGARMSSYTSITATLRCALLVYGLVEFSTNYPLSVNLAGKRIVYRICLSIFGIHSLYLVSLLATIKSLLLVRLYTLGKPYRGEPPTSLLSGRLEQPWSSAILFLSRCFSHWTSIIHMQV